MNWKQAYDTGEFENMVLVPGPIHDLTAFPPLQAFYTYKEAADAAKRIGWPKTSARLIQLPFGRARWFISDKHCRVLTLNGYNRLLAR